MSGRLTTHVLDVSQGKPAAGMRVQLWRLRLAEKGARTMLREAFTNEDGRLGEPLLSGKEMAAGIYELMFDAAGYFRGTAGEGFLEWIPVRFVIGDPQAHYHVPLLVAPGGYSTYRGS
jgi:5-hydroxyisourate hydrolase